MMNLHNYNPLLLKLSPLQIRCELFRRGHFSFIVDKNNEEKNVQQEQALKILTDKETLVLGFGGGAGGSKSWTICVWLAFYSLIYPGIKSFIARKELKILRSSTLVTFFKVCRHYGIKHGVDFKYNGQDNYLIFTNGSRIDLIDIKHEPSDPNYERVGSLEYTIGAFEEAGEINFKAFDTLKTRVGRHLNDAYGISAKVFVTFNPSRNFVFDYFKSAADSGSLLPGWKYLTALVDDNVFNESGYKKNLDAILDPLQKARLRDGNWYAFDGQFFSELDEKVHKKDYGILNDSVLYGGLDWGYTNKGVFLGASFKKVAYKKADPFNRGQVYKEIVWTKKTPEEVGRIIAEAVDLDKYKYVFADPAIFAKGQDGSISIAMRIKKVWGDNGYKLKPANNNRINGWMSVRSWLSIAIDNFPYLFISDNCHYGWQSLPALNHDETNTEDLDTKQEDHFADALRYMLIMIPWVNSKLGTFSNSKLLSFKMMPAISDRSRVMMKAKNA